MSPGARRVMPTNACEDVYELLRPRVAERSSGARVSWADCAGRAGRGEGESQMGEGLPSTRGNAREGAETDPALKKWRGGMTHGRRRTHLISGGPAGVLVQHGR